MKLAFAALVALAACASAQSPSGCPVPTTCPAGYTGRYCDIVLCDMKNNSIPVPPPDHQYPIDIVPFTATCAGTLPIPIDTHVQVLVIMVDGTDSTANPSIQVTDYKGTIIPPTKSITNDGKTLTLGWAAPPNGELYAKISASTPCVYTSYAQTNVSLSVGFTTGDRAAHSDNPLSTLPENTIATLVATFHNLPFPGRAMNVEVYAGAQIVQGYPVKSRYMCGYDLYAGPLVCDSTKLYYFKFHGRDENAYRFMRTQRFLCTPTGPTTTSGPIISTTTVAPACYNGGYLDTTTNKCVCDLAWTGPKCQTPVCGPGSTVSGTTCMCAPNYGGFHCFEPMCASMNPATNSQQQKTLALLVQVSSTMSVDVHQLKAYASQFIESFNQQNPNYIKRYTLISFDSTGSTVLAHASDPFLIIEHIQHLKVSTTPSSCAAGKMTNDAMVKALNMAVPYSNMYVITDSPIDLNDTTTSLKAIELLESTKVKASFIYTAGPNCAPYTSAGVQRMVGIAEFSGGQMYYLKDKSNVFQVLNVMQNSYKASRAFDKQDSRCDQKRTVFVPVDSGAGAFTFSVKGNLPSVVVFSPNGVPYPQVTLVDDGQVKVVQVASPCPDGWLQAGEMCYLGVDSPNTWTYAQVDCRAKGGVLVQILNQPRQDMADQLSSGINYWAGLNDRDNEGNFVWDTRGPVPIPLGSGYNNFPNGSAQPDPNHQKNCLWVQHDATGKSFWGMVPCTARSGYVCQRPVSFVDTARLQAGLWRVDYQTHGSGGDWKTTCHAQVDIQSDIAQYFGYTSGTSGIFNDMVMDEPIRTASNNRYAAQVTGLTTYARVNTVQFYDNGYSDLIGSQRMFYRGKCLYNWVSEPFTCPKSGYGTMISGHDDKGFLFNRISYGICLSSGLREKLYGAERQ